jgi:hypothetical protein
MLERMAATALPLQLQHLVVAAVLTQRLAMGNLVAQVVVAPRMATLDLGLQALARQAKGILAARLPEA